MPLTLEITGPDGAPRVETFAQPVLKVGRHAASHVRLDHPTVSRMHAVIEQEAEADPTVIDLGSETGTFVNRERVNKSVLRPGDHVAIGQFVLHVLATETGAVEGANGQPAGAAPTRPVSATERARVRAYAEKLGLPARLLARLEHLPGVAVESSFWHVATEVWWERRFFRYKRARETAAMGGVYEFGSLTLSKADLPDRWTLQAMRPDPFHAFERREPLEVAGVEELELEVLFGTQTHVLSLGDPAFPASFLHALPVNVRLEGIECTPAVTAPRGGPYREAGVSSEPQGVPEQVMREVRAFVRAIDLPGYTDRIHGWRTVLRGGPFVRARFGLGKVFGLAAGESVDALLIEPSGLVYAPDLTDQ